MGKTKDNLKKWRQSCKENGFWYSVRHPLGGSRKKAQKNDGAAKAAPPSPPGLNISVDPKKLNIGFVFTGGMGDYVIAANYVYCFREKYYVPALSIDVFVLRNEEIARGLFGSDIVNNIYYSQKDLDDKIYRKYDLFISISRYPVFCNRNPGKILMYQPMLLDFMKSAEIFRWKNPRSVECIPTMDGQTAMLSLIAGKKRIWQADVDGLLNITEEYKYTLPIRENGEQYLNGLGLRADQYIVIVNSVDRKNGGFKNNKLWPEPYWDSLYEKIKGKYPDLKVVLMGDVADPDHSVGADLDLSGKTDFEDSKILVKEALLLISSEGGMVHLRHALTDKKSLVLFGPTDMGFFGYSGNINLRSGSCKSPCEWFCKGWWQTCPNPEPRTCMLSLTPNLVFGEVDKFLRENYNNDQT